MPSLLPPRVAAGLTRNWGYYAWKLGVPLLLIVLIALVL